MITKAFVQRHLDRLQQRHPYLAALSIRVIPLSDAPLEAIAALLNTTWDRVYGDRPRLAFSAAFLRMHCGKGIDDGMAVLAEWTGTLCGVALGIPLPVCHKETGEKAILGTGLAVTKEVEGLGVAEALMAHQLLALLEAKCPLVFKWRSVNESQSGSSVSTRARELLVGYYAKPLKTAQCIQRARLTLWSGLGVRVSRLVHGGCRKLPLPYTLKPFTSEYGLVCADYLNAGNAVPGWQRHYVPEEINRCWTFLSDGIIGCGWLLYQDGTLCGVAGGYVNPDRGGLAWFSLDSWVLDLQVPLSVRRAFLSQIEEEVKGRYACFAIMMPNTICSEPIHKWGYHCVKRYRLGYELLGSSVEMTPGMVKGLQIALR